MCSVAINCEQDRFNAINPTLRATAALECTLLCIHNVCWVSSWIQRYAESIG